MMLEMSLIRGVYFLYSIWKCIDSLKLAMISGTSKYLNSLVQWSIKNELILNTSKCSVVTFSKRHNPSQYAYDINSQTLMRSVEIKDLGVFFDQQLNFTQHYNKITDQAFKQLGFILRREREFSFKTLKILYCTYVHPRWNMHH